MLAPSVTVGPFSLSDDMTSMNAFDAACYGGDWPETKREKFAKLPRMTDPMGRHWRQPKGLRDRVKIFETHAVINESDWQELSRYDSTMPSGVYAGKVWRCRGYLCWYGKPRMVTERGRTFEVCSNGVLRALVV